MHAPLAALALLAIAAGQVRAQEPDPVIARQEGAADAWELSASLAFYFVEGDENYLWPTVMADRDWLHLEARYNYEDLDTASLWLGYNLSFGEELTVADDGDLDDG